MKRLGIASFVIGAVLVAFFGVLIVRNLPSTPKAIEGGMVHLSKPGLTLWASEDHVPAVCEVKGPDGSDVPLVSDQSSSLQINDGEWFSVARSAKSVPPGDYAVNCIASGVTADTEVTFSAAPRMSILIFVLAILGAVFSLIIAIGLGSVLLAAGARRRKRDTFPSGPPPGYPQHPGYPQPGYPQQPGSPQYGPGVQQPGSTFPGYPPPSTYHPGPNPDRPQDRPQDRPHDGPYSGPQGG
jgi:hypothetical protein